MRPWLAVFTVLSFLLIHMPGSDAGFSAELNLAPLLHYQSGPEGFDLSIAGPLLEFSSNSTAVRPFYYRDEEQTDILYPLGHSSEKDSSEDSYFVPLMRYTDEKDEKHLDALLFSYGRYGDETYGGFFPFYGTFSHRFGHDHVRYVLWPAYTKTVDDGIETTTILWPFLKYSAGREFQFFPFYGYENTATSRKTYVLWPFFLHKTGRENADAFLPFFYYSRGGTHKGISVLWPFFTYNRNTSPELTSLTFPWPIVRYATGAYEEREFFPFYWSMDQGETYRSKMILWPFYRHTSSYNPTDDIREETTRVLVLSGRTTKTRQQDVESRETTVWPLWHKHDFKESSSWFFPWIIPLHDQGFRRNYLPLLTLAQGQRTDASSEVSILWRTLYSRKGEGTRRIALSFLFSYERGPGYKQIGFLSDLLHVRWSSPSGEGQPPSAP